MSSYLEKRRSEMWFGKAPKEKVVAGIAKVSKKKLQQLAEEKKDRETSGDFTLDQWFEHFMATSEPVCAECGMRADWIKGPGYEEIWRACQAHILPKRKRYGFPSIATILNNHIVLFPSWGGHLCGCHGFYDSNWYNASTMKIWPQVVETVKTKLLPVIAASERKNIPEIFQTTES